MANVGTVQSVTGIVKAIAEDGTERILSIGDTVAENEKIVTGDGVIVIAFTDGTVLDLGSNSSIVLNEDVLNQEGEQIAQNRADANDEVAVLQEALANNPDFDPTAELPATAAGPAAGGTEGNNGHSIVSVDYLNPDAPVESGFDTTGISTEFTQPEEELPILPEEQEAIINTTLAVDLESGGVFEDETITYVATLDQASEGNITVTLSNGSVILIPANSLTGTVTIPAQGDDVYIDPELVATSISGVSGGGGETLTFDSTPVEVQIVDTIDPVTVSIATSDVQEDTASTFTVSVSQILDKDLTVELSTGDSVVITAGQLSVNYEVPAQGDDVYVDPGSVTVGIDGASVAGDTFENLILGPEATSAITDTIDTTTVTLDATASVEVKGLITYTATVDNAPLTTNLVLTITDENGVVLGDITILAGATSGTLDVVAPDTEDTSYDVSITSATGGTYEDLDITDGASTIVNEVPASSALLVTNTNNEVQLVEVIIASDEGANTTGVVEQTEVEGQEGSALTFGADVVFTAGENYTVTTEHVDGPPIILTDLAITDSQGNVLEIYEGNAKLETGDTTGNTNPDGYIFNVSIGDNYATDATDYTVSEAIGYEVLGGVLTLDTETETSDFVLDFSELAINGTTDLFGDVEEIDISGKGTGEDNAIYISAQDILDLGTSSDSSIIITGDVDDVVNLVDLDNGSAGTWAQVGTTDTYTYTGGTVDATAIIDNALTVNLNTTPLDGL